MHYFQESLATWTGALGAIATVVGLIQSRGWLVTVSALLLGVSLVSLLYARNKRQAVDAASIKIEGRSVDSLNIANLRRRVTQDLVVQEVEHVAQVEREDLKVTWKYSGYCRASHVSSIEFSLDSDSSIPFRELDCFAYDLRHDPGARAQNTPSPARFGWHIEEDLSAVRRTTHGAASLRRRSRMHAAWLHETGI